MIWSLEIFSAVWFGYEVASLFCKKILDSISKLAIGAILGIIIQSWFGFILSYFVGLTPLLGSMTVLTFSAISLCLYLIRRKQNDVFTFNLSSIQGWTYFISFSLFFLMMYLSMFKDYSSTKGSGFSDLPFHLNIISSIAYGFNSKRKELMSIDSSFYSGEKLVYPIIPNFYSAFLISTGHTSSRYALLIPSTIVGFSMIVSFYSLCLYFTRSHVGALLSIIIFSNLSGMGFIVLFDKNCVKTDDFTHNWCRDRFEYWFHPLMHIIIPQRAALWSFPLCFWSYLCLILGVKLNSFKMMALAGILTGLMPQVQLHSYVSIAQWSIIYCILNIRKKGFWRYFWQWALFGFIAVAVALPQCESYFKKVNSDHGSFLKIKPIWEGENMMEGRKFKPFTLWFYGLGFFAIISLILCWPTLYKEQILMYVPSVIVFLIANFVRYQPWFLDNTKVFYAGWIPIAVPACAFFFTRLVNMKMRIIPFMLCTIIATILFILTILSGFLTTIKTMEALTPLFSYNNTYQFGLWIAENTPVDAIFAANGFPANPISSIGGRKAFVGYGGWVHSHGYSMNKYWDLIRHLPRGNDIEWYTRNNISYAGSFDTSETRFANANGKWDMVYSDGPNVLYRIKPQYRNNTLLL